MQSHALAVAGDSPLDAPPSRDHDRPANQRTRKVRITGRHSTKTKQRFQMMGIKRYIKLGKLLSIHAYSPKTYTGRKKCAALYPTVLCLSLVLCRLSDYPSNMMGMGHQEIHIKTWHLQRSKRLSHKGCADISSELVGILRTLTPFCCSTPVPPLFFPL